MAHQKTTIITGATGGIGECLARAYLNKGHNLVLTGRKEERLNELQKELGEPSRVAVCAGDLRDHSHIQSIIDLTRDRFRNTLANLINNAGTFLVKPFLSTTKEDIQEFQDFFAGSYALTQKAVAQMKAQSDIKNDTKNAGSIVFVSTIFSKGFIPQFPSSAVGAVKAGYTGLTRNVAYELAKMGIRVNTLELGVIKTPIYGLDDEGMKTLEPLQPLGMVGSPEDIAEASIFLTEKSPFTTGQILTIDGGVSAGHFGG